MQLTKDSVPASRPEGTLPKSGPVDYVRVAEPTRVHLSATDPSAPRPGATLLVLTSKRDADASITPVRRSRRGSTGIRNAQKASSSGPRGRAKSVSATSNEPQQQNPPHKTPLLVQLNDDGDNRTNTTPRPLVNPARVAELMGVFDTQQEPQSASSLAEDTAPVMRLTTSPSRAL
ncbi:hypothetical protein EIP86_005112 [Pleurotus ostreatoroseus]|nr:hypothetical protein EIP86_005112 [Pleurotus ostreatoroseus]